MVTPSASGSESSARSRAERTASRSRMMRGRCFPSVASLPMSGGRPSASRCAVASESSRDFGLPCAGAEQQPRQRRVRLDVDDDRAHRTPAAPAFGEISADIRPFSHGSSELAVGDDLQRRNVVGDDPRQRLVDHAVVAASRASPASRSARAILPELCDRWRRDRRRWLFPRRSAALPHASFAAKDLSASGS